MLSKHPYWLSLIAGAGSATGFAPLNLWPATLIAFAIWIAIIAQARSRKAVFLSGWLFGIGQFVVGLNWIAKAFTFQSAMPEWLGYIAVVLLSLYLAVFPALAGLSAYMLTNLRHSREGGNPAFPFRESKLDPRLRGGDGVTFILALAGFWIITEWLRSWAFSGFIWNPLGMASHDTLWFVASWFGIFGLSGFLILFAGLVLRLVSGFRSRRWFGHLTYLAIFLIFGGIIYFDYELGDLDAALSEKARHSQPLITVVQPNIGQQDKWKAGYEERNLEKLARLTLRGDDTPHIIFWPEAAIPDYLEAGYPQRYYFGRPPEFVRAQLASLMKPGDVLVLGALKLEFGQAGKRAIGARNSIFAMDSDRELMGRYDKAHLVPYGEYLPMRPVLEAIGLSRLAPGDFDFWPGPGPRSLDIGKFGKMGLQVCYEIIFSGHVVDPDNRPDFIFNPSNDAWFGAWGPPQHLAQARMRAIEEGLPVIRSTPTGISAVIDSNGIVTNSIPMGEAGRIDTWLPKPKSPTLFSRHGNMLPLGFALILLLSAIAIRLRSR